MMEFAWAANLLPLMAAGFAVGVLVGLTGVGGGALMTPVLISSLGVAPPVAVGTDLLYASITKTAGGWRHHVADHVDWPVVLRLAAGSLPAAILLLAVIAMLPETSTYMLAHWIRMGLVVALPISGLAIVLYPFATRKSPSNDKGDVPPRTVLTVLFGVVLGLLVTLTSVGAGAIGVTACGALSVAAGEAPGRYRYRACRAAHAARRARSHGTRQCRRGSFARAALRLDPGHPDRRTARGRRAGMAAQANPRAHALLRGLGAVQQRLGCRPTPRWCGRSADSAFRFRLG
jgi:uncharacterized membrane protein YfcA